MTAVEEFKTKEARDERLTELKARGHGVTKHSDQVPILWETRFYLTYSPESRKLKKVANAQ